MANPERGEVGFDLDGEEYTLRLTTGAQIAIEDRAGLGLPGVVKRMTVEGRTTDAVIFFWAMLRDSDNKRPSFEEAVEIVDGITGAKAGELIGKALIASGLVPKGTEAGGTTKGKPRTTKSRSTGANSKSHGPKQAAH